MSIIKAKASAKSTVLQVALLLAKQVLFCKSPSWWRSEYCFASRPGGEACRSPCWRKSWIKSVSTGLGGPGEKGHSTLLSLLATGLGGPGEGGHSTLLSLLATGLGGPGEEGHSTLLSLLAKVLGGPGEEGHSTLLSLLATGLGGPGEEGHSTLLSLLATGLGGPGEEGHSTLLSLLGPGEEGRSTLLSLLATGLGGPADDDVVAAHAQCKVEASEHSGFERHGNADTPELKRRPDWLEKNWHKELRDDHIKMLKSDTESYRRSNRQGK